MSLVFTHDTLGQRVVMDAGRGIEHVIAEVARLGCQRVMLIADAFASATADALIDAGLPVARRWDEVVQHVPIELAERARAAAHEAGTDGVVTLGGGSATGLGKAIALEAGTPLVAVPTTFAGSEATPMWGLTEDATKHTGVDPIVLPRAVVYDADLLGAIPTSLAVNSALNALAHAVDALWAPKANPITTALALEGSRALATGLPRLAARPDRAGIEDTLYGAYLAAVAFASSGAGLHHKICHVLGGTFNLPHAATHAIVLPRVLAFNEPVVPDLGQRLCHALGGTDTAAATLTELYHQVNAPNALRDIGMPESGIPDAVERVLAVAPPSNPRAVEEATLTQLLRAAWDGR